MLFPYQWRARARAITDVTRKTLYISFVVFIGAEPLEPPSRETSILLTGYGGTTDEDLELIDLRYQQSVALMDLEYLFADGCFDCL
jgi:hypothetical protein